MYGYTYLVLFVRAVYRLKSYNATFQQFSLDSEDTKLMLQPDPPSQMQQKCLIQNYCLCSL